jgi:hypothetical protein
MTLRGAHRVSRVACGVAFSTSSIPFDIKFNGKRAFL